MATKIVNGTLIDGMGNPPVPNPGILIEGNRITRMGFEPDDHVPGNVIDATGQYMMPGMIDGHVHISSHQGNLGVNEQTGPEYAALWTAHVLPRILRAGVTGIAVPGGRHFVDVTLRDCVDAGFVVGPRMFTAARALGPRGGIFDNTMSWEEQTPADSVGVVCNSVDDYIREVRRQAKRGVDMIKIADDYWGDVQGFSQADLAAVVDEAHRFGKPVVIHARGAGSTRAAAQAGVDIIYHADLATEDDLQVVAEAGVPIMPVFTGAALAYSLGWGERLRTQLEQQFAMVRRARELGIEILSGTDSGNAATFAHGTHHGNEPVHLVQDIGYTPIEAIETITRKNAKVIGLDGEVGTIETGKLADIIVWTENPVDDITVLKRPELLSTVIKDGDVIVGPDELVAQSDQVFRQLDPEPGRYVK